jgi:3,2-trans-enoyl-CoA isomerase
MLNLISHADIHEIQLARPPVNALNLELLRALRTAIDDSVRASARGIVLSGAPGLFSAGVDIPTLLGGDRADVREYWREFFALCATMARAPIPLVAAVTGHSPAGGAVLALFCDYRVMAAGSYRIGLNEVQVGLIVPEAIQLALRRVVGAYRAERLLMAGAMLESADALACGFVDELATVDQVIPRALTWLGELLALPSHAMLTTRQLARADLAAAYADLDALPLDEFVEEFFHPQTQAVLQQLVARLKHKG